MAISGAGTPGQPGQGAEDQGVPAEGGQDVNWQERATELESQYNNLRPEYTRATQSLSEYEQLFDALTDPETQAEALASLGFELETGTPQGGPEKEDLSEWEDPLEQKYEELQSEVSELRSQRELEAQEKEAAEINQLRDDYIGEAIGYIEQETKRKFSEDAERVLGNLAIAMEGPDGVPDVQGAYNALYGKQGVVEAERERWTQGKLEVAQAPFGTTAPADRKPTTPRERAAYFDERLRAQEQGGY